MSAGVGGGATTAGRVCWIDTDWDRSQASDGISRYGAYLRSHSGLFDPWHDQDAADGITQDPGEFAIAAFRVATGPIMSPGYVGWHPRVLDYQVSHGDNPEPGRLVLKVTLATSLPLWLGSPWWSWTEYLGRDWREPDEDRHAALASLALRWPLPVASLPRPRPPARPGVPNLADAKASVRALVTAINATAGPVLAKLEGGAGR
ncbi:MAG TPA: hypothetical protein VIV12_29530 [Streptosporangiaceae bacterium]